MRLFTDKKITWQGEPFTLNSPGLKKGEMLPALPDFSAALPGAPSPCLALSPPLFTNSLADGPLSAGTLLAPEGGAKPPLLAVLSRGYLTSLSEAHSAPCLRLLALDDVPQGRLSLTPRRSGPAVAWVTVSDKGSVGLREDKSGPAIAELAEQSLEPRCLRGFILPDEIHRLRALVADLALTQGYDLIITSGGTGLTPRDITPEALLPLIEKRLPGLEQAMMQSSLAVTPRGALSRAVCGSIGSSLLVTLPGSTKAVRENLQAVLGALAHGLEKLQGSGADCGRH